MRFGFPFPQAPYKVHLSLEALLVVDIHAHCSREVEVMGLLGGCLKSGTLYIKSAVPCRASYSSNTHCDMCPGKTSKPRRKVVFLQNVTRNIKIFNLDA